MIASCTSESRYRASSQSLAARAVPSDPEPDLAALSALGNDTRYAIVRLLAAADEDLCVCEIAPVVGVSDSAISRALSDLRNAGLVTRRKEGTWRYYAVIDRATALLDALDATRGMPMADPVRVAFVCVRNAGRSQMATAFAERELERRGLESAVEILTGGTRPAGRVHDVVVTAMDEAGVDLSDRVPREITTAELASCDYVATMGCSTLDLDATGGDVRDWALDDPGGRDIEWVREIRDEVRRRVRALFDEIKRRPEPSPPVRPRDE